MNKTRSGLGALLAGAMLATGCTGSFEEVRTPFHASVAAGPSPTVTITNIVGEVRVKPSDAGIVKVDAVKYASNESGLASIDIIARGADGGVSVETLYRNEHDGGVRYDITVPMNASVRITNTTGTIDVGPIGGSVLAHTATGTIDVRLGRIAAPRSVDLKSSTGTIALHIAADSSASISASTSIGSISSDFPSIEAVRSNLLGSNAAGRIGDGTATVRLSVATGSISIARN